jgi:hypothetical protein
VAEREYTAKNGEASAEQRRGMTQLRRLPHPPHFVALGE